MILTKATGHFTETEIDDEIVVMSLESGDFFSLTGTAKAIWLVLDAGLDRQGLIAHLVGEFGAAPDAIGPDVDTFLEQLRGAGLLASR